MVQPQLVTVHAEQVSLFDYAALDAETRIVVAQEDKEFDRSMEDAGRSFVRACQSLQRIHAALRYKRPGFVDYVASKPGLSQATAYRMLDVAKKFPNLVNIHAAPSALYLLAAPLTPEPARLEALARAEAGEYIGHAEARRIVAEHKADPGIDQRSAQAAPEPEPEPIPPPAFTPRPTPNPAHAPPLPPRLAEPEPEPAPAPEPPRLAVHFSSATPEWYTPAHIVDRVVALFGHIDLDPCSNAKGDAANVPARYHFTREDDGLAQSWAVPGWVDDHGDESRAVRVYMNPPYGDEISAWVERLTRAYEQGEITDAIALLPARVDTAWFAQLNQYPVCFVRGRLRFVGGEHSAPFPSAIVYLGCDLDGFVEQFEGIGAMYKPV